MKRLFLAISAFTTIVLADAIYPTTVTVPANLPTPYTVSAGTYAIMQYAGTVGPALCRPRIISLGERLRIEGLWIRSFIGYSAL
jgi:hypothetical protein